MTSTGAAAAAAAAGPTYRLLRPGDPGAAFTPSQDQRAVIDNRDRRLRVLAGPGTGKTATIVEAVAERIERRAIEPGRILVLTFSRRGAGELRDRLGRRLTVTTDQPLVRTLHSYAYALLAARAARAGEPAPRMLGAAESDRVVGDLLAGHLQAGAAQWPAHLRPALRSPAFIAELRDLVLRTGERALSPAGIAALGRRHRRPEWTAAARLAREYQQVIDLRMGTTGLGAALDQAELTLAALDLLHRDEVLAAEQSRIRRVFVDEYQDVDPAQAALVERLASGADEVVVVGDPDQAIYAFRGSDPGALRGFEADRTVGLTTSRRSGAVLLAATRRLAALLPGPAAHRRLEPGPGAPDGSVEIRILPTAAREAAYIADRFRRARLREGVPFSRMAVLMRSPAASLPALRRAFSASGIPIATIAEERGRPDDPLVTALLSLLECGQDPEVLDGARAEELLIAPLGPAGGLDVLALRRLRRAVRAAAIGSEPATEAPDTAATGAALSTADRLAALLAAMAWHHHAGAPHTDAPGWVDRVRVPVDLRPGLQHLAGLLRIAREQSGVADGERALWRLWSATEMERRLLAAVERGGRAGSRADETLDALVAMFDRAADLAVRMPGAGVRTLLDVLRGEQLPGDPGHRSPTRGEAVSVLSAHAAKGLQWDLVAVAGVQEGRWPDLRTRNGLLGTEDLLDAHAGIDQRLSRTPALLADERRLFYVACTRARRDLLLTAVDDEERAPSRFLDDVAGTGGPDAVPITRGWPRIPGGRAERRALRLPELVGELRRIACSSAAEPEMAAQAVRQLARLAAAGVPGAHPDQWYGLAGPSSTGPAVAAGAPVTVSASGVEALQQCGLRGVLERRGARGPAGDAQILGMMVHAAAAGLSEGLSVADVTTEIDRFLASDAQLPDWQLRRIRRAVTSMAEAAARWLADNAAAGRRTLGAEVGMDLALPAGRAGEHPVRLTGRIDHVAQAADGSVLISDFKTGSSVVSAADALQHLQLAAYQLAVQLRGIPGADGPPGGAQLVYLRDGTPRVRTQPPLDDELAATATAAVAEAAGYLAGSDIPAQENPRCERCPVRSCCPLQSEGRQVTR